MTPADGTFSQRVADLTTRVALLDAGATAIREDIKRILTLVDGNGSASGLTSRMANLEYTAIRNESEIAAIKSRIDDLIVERKRETDQEEERRKKRADNLTVSVIMLVISTVISITVQIAQKFIK